MDHLPPVSENRNALPRVPYACTSISSAIPGGYSTFATAYGVDMKTYNYHNFNGMSNQEVACFFQEWLFFRLIGSIFSLSNIAFRRNDFIITHATNETLVTTSRLPAYLWYWLAAEMDTAQSLKKKKHNEVTTMLRETANVMVEVNVQHSNLHPLLSNTFASITLTGELLSYAALLVYDKEHTDTPIVTWPRSQLLSTLMKEAGWCAHELAVHLYREHNNALLYLRNFSQHSTFDHSSCTDAKCNINQLNYDEYSTKHVDSCQDCEFLGVDWTREESIALDLEAHRIPLFSVSKRHPETQNVQLFRHISKALNPPKTWVAQTLSRFRSDKGIQNQISRYVAISHVWSDGMGNTTSNTLPTCQLLQLQGLVDHLYPIDEKKPIPFWVDTICVPRPPELRAKALQRMRQTYEKAEKVLVLDSSIRSISLTQCSPEEAFMRVRCARWSRRLWTYQEGLLAKKLYFQFKDKVISGDEILQRVTRDRFNSKDALLLPQEDFLLQALSGPHSFQARRLLRALGKPGNLRKADRKLRCKIRYGFDMFLNNSISYFESSFSEGRTTKTLEEVAYALSQRTTSRLGDETICIANLMNLGDEVQKGLLEIDSEDISARMIRLLELVATIPKEIIFSPGPRLEKRGYRWAPQSFMSKGQVSLYYDVRDHQNIARIHPQGLGLNLSAPGILLDETSRGFRESESIRLDVHIQQKIRPYEIFIPGWSWNNISRSQKLAIILREPLRDWYQNGALVSFREMVLSEDSTKSLMVAFRKQVVLTPYLDHRPSIPDAYGKLLSGSLLWCVD